MLALDSAGILVSREKGGGVWSISTNGMTIPLSDSWTNLDVNCLCGGPDDSLQHFFAGCMGEIIRETDLGGNLPLLSWVLVNNPLPAGAGDVHRIVVIRNLCRIVGACDGGLF